jgi:hypothetical protein
MSKRRGAVVGFLAAGIGLLGLVLPAAAHATTRPKATLPPLCLRVPLPNPVLPGAQIQVGYCP